MWESLAVNSYPYCRNGLFSFTGKVYSTAPLLTALLKMSLAVASEMAEICRIIASPHELYRRLQ